MRRDILEALTQQLERKSGCACVTNLHSGQQALLYEGGERGNLTLNEAQRIAVLRRIKADKSGLEGNIFIRVYAPPRRVVIIGAVHVAQFLCPMAKLVGFDVTVIDPREAFFRSASLSGFDGIIAWPDEGLNSVSPDSRTAIVTLTHDPKLDDIALSTALRTPAFYIGALGSKANHAKRLKRLASEGFSAADLDRINGPVGLAINAQSPAEISVSIMAQVIESLRVVVE